jgi:hypothetical protein
MKKSVLGALLPAFILAASALSQDAPPLVNWAAPPYWLPATTAGLPSTGHSIPAEAALAVPGRETLALPSPPLPFVAITPCRLADTRATSGFPAGYGPPSMPGFHTQRSFTITGQCGIPADAQAVSFNFAVWAPVTRGDIRVFPAGVTPPGVATLNWEANILALSNAAIVPLGTGGAITVQVDGPGTIDLIIDVNGYYSPVGVVRTVNSLSGDLTLAPGTNISITPGGGNTLTITNTAPGGGVLPAGSSDQTLRHDGGSWVASSALANDGTNIGISGNLDLPATTATTGQIRLAGYPFLHVFGTNNTFLGISSGNLTLTGMYNTAVGHVALRGNTSGNSNTAIGKDALAHNTSGSGGTGLGRAVLQENTLGTFNTAVGFASMKNNTTANNNTAVGVGAMYLQNYANNDTPWDADNTAVGYEALSYNAPTSAANGIRNTAVGSWAMRQNKTGPYNAAIGYQSLYNNDSGSYNTALGYQTLLANTTGIQNTAVGDWAGHENQTGSNNVFLGNEAGYWETGPNRLYIANAAATALIYGEFDNQRVAINAMDPAATLDVNGSFRVRTLPVIGGGNPVCTGFMNVFGLCGVSDARLKKNIVSLSEDRDVLSGLAGLRAVSFDWNLSPGMLSGRTGRDLGVIAQEVETVLPEVVSTNADGYKSVDYSKLTAFLIEVAKAQQKEIDQQRAELDDLKALVRQLAATR